MYTYLTNLDVTLQDLSTSRLTILRDYTIISLVSSRGSQMATSSYLVGQKQKYRVTLELEVLEDFDPHQIDWGKVLDLQGSERAQAYVEDLSTPDRW